MATGLAALVLGCGGGEGETPEEVVSALLEAHADGDREAACALLTEDAQESAAQLSISFGAPEGSTCEEVGQFSAGIDAAAAEGDAEVETVEESAEEATVEITGEGGGPPFELPLVKDGEEWKIDGLGEAVLEE